MNDREQEPRPGLYREEDEQSSLHSSYEREDERWRGANQLRDWLIIIGLLAAYCAWWVTVYFLEPGIR